jgi:hypothetical protein
VTTIVLTGRVTSAGSGAFREQPLITSVDVMTTDAKTADATAILAEIEMDMLAILTDFLERTGVASRRCRALGGTRPEE